MRPRSVCTPALLLAVSVVAWIAGAASSREPARASESPATSAPALQHQFMNNLDSRRQAPDARGYLSVTFAQPLPASPTMVLHCANPRYAVKVHDANRTSFAFAIYRMRDILRSNRGNPFEGAGAARPVTDFRDTDNIDLAWVAVAG